VVSDDEFPVIQVGSYRHRRPRVRLAARFVVMLNKPRGLVTTTRDERAGTPFTDVRRRRIARLAPLDGGQGSGDFCLFSMIPRGRAG